MPDIQPTAESEETEPPVRYVLQRLPPPELEAFQRSKHRNQVVADRVIFSLMVLALVGLLGFAAVDIALGNPSATYSSVGTLLYACLVGFLAFKGGAGVRGEYHHVNPHNCALALEDQQLADVGAEHQHGDLGNIPGELVPEYLRLLRLSTEAYEYAHGLRQQLDEIKFHGMENPEAFIDTGRLPAWPLRDNHVD